MSSPEPASLSPPDADLVTRIRAGDPAAFTEMMALYFDASVKLAYRFLHSRDAAKDAVQDVYARVWEQRATFAPTRSLKSYLFGAVYHRAMNEIRAARIHERHASTNLLPSESTTSAMEIQDATAVDTHITVAALLAKLPPRRRTVLELRYLGQLSYADIGKIIGSSPGAVEQLVIRAMDQLRRGKGLP